MYSLMFLLIPLASAGIAWLCSQLLLNKFFSKFKNNIHKQGAIQSLGMQNAEALNFIYSYAITLLHNAHIQQIIKDKIGEFLKKEFSVMLNFVSNSFIENVKQKLLIELNNILEDKSFGTIEMNLEMKEKINAFFIKTSFDFKNKISYYAKIYIALIGFIIGLCNCLLFIWL